MSSPRFVPFAYGFRPFFLAAIVRVFGPAVLPIAYLATVESAAVLWIAGFAIYVIVYGPILTRQRADGRPG